ncbi:MAG TPA: serine O-acetyltransferase [Thermoanaerobaculia bacterium]|nr:serine O-acetyltransferase [Thermoanaerobaculia bacterium]
MFDHLREDTRRLRATKRRGAPWYVIESLLFETGYQAVVLHRLAHWFRSRRIPFFGPAIARFNQFLTGADISPAARIGPGLQISHGTGIVVGWEVVIGRDCLIMQGVTLGAPDVARLGEMPTLGDRVVLGAGCAVIGKVTIGDDCLVGVHALVTEDLPAGHRALAPRAKTGDSLRISTSGPAPADD